MKSEWPEGGVEGFLCGCLFVIATIEITELIERILG